MTLLESCPGWQLYLEKGQKHENCNVSDKVKLDLLKLSTLKLAGWHQILKENDCQFSGLLILPLHRRKQSAFATEL